MRVFLCPKDINDMTATEITAHGLETDHIARRYRDVSELLPGVDNPSPLVRLNRVIPPTGALAYLKLEWLNPFGSIKDRVASHLLAGIRERGELGGRDLVEATSGNTGIALAALAALSGIGVTLTIPDGIPEEKKVILRMLGAEVWETPDDLCPVDLPKDGAIALARSLAASENGGRFAMADQYRNQDNVEAHYRTTGPEIWLQTGGRVRWFVTGLGTGGTVTGVGRYLKERDPTIRIVAVEPQPGHRLPGLKNLTEAKQPEILDLSVVDDLVRVDDEPAYLTTRRLWREEALTVGPSTGAVVEAINRLETSEGDLVVGISADSGFKYTSYLKQILGDEGRPRL
jgi:S-sulfo-L-cysteine synthase (O-acetyl-L-serine-dependent)